MLKSHRSRFATIALMAAVSLSMMAGCHSSSTAPPSVAYAVAPAAGAPAYAQPVAAPAPVVVQAAAPHDRTGDLLLGAVAGGLATHALTNSRQAAIAPAPAPSPTTTINKTVIHKTTIVQAPPSPAPLRTAALNPTSARPTVSLAKSPNYASTSYRAPSSYASTTTKVSYSPSISTASRR